MLSSLCLMVWNIKGLINVTEVTELVGLRASILPGCTKSGDPPDLWARQAKRLEALQAPLK